jgi:hypothetical protein
MDVVGADMTQEAYREASDRSIAKSGTEDGAMSLLVLSSIALIAMFSTDMGSVSIQLILLIRIILIGVVLTSFVVGYRASKDARAAENTMTELRRNNPHVTFPF